MIKATSLSANFFLKMLKHAKHGRVEVRFPNDETEIYGEGHPLVHVHIKNWQVFDLLVSQGDMGLAIAIMENDLVVDDAPALVEWACRNDQALAQGLHGTWTGTLVYQLKRLINANTRRGAKNNIIAHYDLGNEFYRLWLDPSMTYSSAIYQHDGESLTEAQRNKYDRMIDQLNIKSGDRVLEIGCGWGGFFSRAVERTGCHVTAVMNSPSQRKFNQQLLVKNGMHKQVDLQEIDYRDIEGKFDKVVSIEMIEAVGEKHWPDYFAKVSASLKSKGTALIQGITIREDLFYSYRKNTDFIQQLVFPGGMLLTNEAIAVNSQKNGLNMSDKYEFGVSYAETLKQWRKNFHKARPQVVEMGFDEKFIRLWDLYLAYCEGAFRAGRINVGQYSIHAIA